MRTGSGLWALALAFSGGLSACGMPAYLEVPGPIQVASTRDPYGPTFGDPYAHYGYTWEEPVYEQGQGTANPILQILTPAINDVVPGQPVALSVTASHPKELPMAFAWAATGGILSADAGKAVSWTPPQSPGAYVVTVVVTDQQGGLATGRMNLIVKGPNGEIPTPPPSGPNPAAGANPTPNAGASAAPVVPTQEAELARVEGLVTALPLRYLADVELLLVRADSETQAFEARSTRSDASGRFKFEGLPVAYKLRVVARAPGMREARIDLTTMKGTTARADFWGMKGLIPN